jgi:DNA invertase Pin-like site-specific DNA recombinase
MIGYCRVSTEEQAREGVSMEAQRKRLAAYCTAQGYELIGIESDNGTSGSVAPGKRPGLARALALVRKGEADGLLALKLDRISRSTRTVLELVDDCRRRGWRLVSVYEQLDTGSAAGRLVLTVLAALAEMEREQVSERTRFALSEVASQGRARSRFTPYGWRTGEGGTEQRKGDRDVLVEEPQEQRILRRMLDLQAQGEGPSAIALCLNRNRLRQRNGRPWSRQRVAQVLQRHEEREEARRSS